MNPKHTRNQGGKMHFNKNFKQRMKKSKKKQIYESKPKGWKIIDDEIETLKSQYPAIDASRVKHFTDFPLSKKTLQGLKQSRFDTPTEIQRESIGLALQGNDILGAAKTGSGKTLAFLIPILECLYRQKWSPMDGLGALIISPTRELAYQTFEVLKKVGKSHDFSAGLVIGGKLLKEESARINRTNIVVCTPGRLLQHMDETVNFTADSLQILVLDEADRILDMGFAKDMNAIIENLPSTRQTLLFSATQTKSVRDLARLSLKDPMFVSVHENAQHSTPVQLEQNYIICDLHDKMNMLWSFLKNHLKSKILVFFTSCKQVKYVFEAIKRLRPGVTVLSLHGGMNQLKRVDVYNQFCRKQHAVLFATDIAARGLDFPAVNWVVQMDCPEDANTYIHRVGRTARFEKDGESLLVLLPSEEEGMIPQLQEKKIPVEKIRVNPKKFYSIQSKLESNLAADPELKATAQRAFLGYLRSVFLMSNKKVFNVHKLDTDQYARSLGLAIPPRVRFLKREEKRLAEKESKQATAKLDKKTSQETNDDSSSSESETENIKARLAPPSEEESDDSEEDDKSDDDDDDDDVKSNSNTDENESSAKERKDKSVTRTTRGLDEMLDFHVDDDVDDLFIVRRTYLASDSEEEEGEEVIPEEGDKGEAKKKKAVTKYTVAKKLQKKKVKVNTKVVFDEEGKMVEDTLKKPQAKLSQEEESDDEGGININVAKQRMKKEDMIDKQLYREKIKQKHKEERIKKKEKLREKKRKGQPEEDDEEEMVAVLGGGEEQDDLDQSHDLDPEYSNRSDSEEEAEFERDIVNSSDDEDSYRPEKKKRKIMNTTQESDRSDEDRNLPENDVSDEVEEQSEDEDDDDDDDDGVMDTGLGLEEDEAIAMKLLSGT